MTAQVWAIIGVGVAVVAVAIAGFGLLWNAINSLGSGLGARIDAQALRTDALGLRIDGIEHELHGVNRTLGELVGMAHTHDHAA